ncbi:MAG: hypothetical protein ACRENL_01550 [Candidatus Dormibacteria bacterium]
MATRRIAVVARADGSVDRYPVTPRVDLNFERGRKTGLGIAFSGPGGGENVYWLGWYAEKAAGGVIAAFEEWIDQVSSVEVETEPIAPFVAAAPDAGSPSSPSPAP